MAYEKFNEFDLETACDDLAMLPYWPAEARASVMRLLAQMCPHREALQWLVAECVNHVAKWPGPAELRGLLCTRYTPADKIDGWTTLPGYRADDCEARFLAEHDDEKHQERIGVSGESRDILRQLVAGSGRVS